MSIFSRNSNTVKFGDAKVAVLEGWGGRATIHGEDPNRTQENLMRVVQGLPLLASEVDVSAGPEKPIQTKNILARTLGRLTSAGSIHISRQGGGVRTAIFRFDPENPFSCIEKTTELTRARKARVMPFDGPN